MRPRAQGRSKDASWIGGQDRGQDRRGQDRARIGPGSSQRLDGRRDGSLTPPVATAAIDLCGRHALSPIPPSSLPAAVSLWLLSPVAVAPAGLGQVWARFAPGSQRSDRCEGRTPPCPCVAQKNFMHEILSLKYIRVERTLFRVA